MPNTVDQIADLVSNGRRAHISKLAWPPKAAGAWSSAWTTAGNPSAGAIPPLFSAGSGYTCNKDTIGSLPYLNPASLTNWLVQLGITATQPGSLYLYDRLWSCSGMGFAAGTYAVTAPGALPPRITDRGKGCQLWTEQFVAAGAATGTLTANYLNSAVAPVARSAVVSSVVSAPVQGQMQPIFNFQSEANKDDLGISQLTSVVTSATWTSGSFGMTIMKPICGPISIEIGSAAGKQLDWANLPISKLVNDMCIQVLWQAAGTVAPILIGSCIIGEGA